MSPHAFSEDQLVEQPAVGLFAELGWTTVSASDEIFGTHGTLPRSQLKIAIEDVLDTGLPRAYGKPLYEQKCAAVFEHVYESYPERDIGVYATPV